MVLARFKQALENYSTDFSEGTLDRDLVNTTEYILEKYLKKLSSYIFLSTIFYLLFVVSVMAVMVDSFLGYVLPGKVYAIPLLTSIIGIPALLGYYLVRGVFVTYSLTKQSVTVNNSGSEDHLYIYEDNNFNEIFSINRQTAKSCTVILLLTIFGSFWIYVIQRLESLVQHFQAMGEPDFLFSTDVFSILFLTALDVFTKSQIGTTFSEMGTEQTLEIISITPFFALIYFTIRHMALLVEYQFEDSAGGFSELPKYGLLIYYLMIVLLVGELRQLTFKVVLTTIASGALVYGSVRFILFFYFM